jgi:hypothetical protein
MASAVLLIAGLAGILTFAGPASAAGSITVTPNTGLSGGSVVSVSGSGLAAGSTGAILECNSDPSQPTITALGNSVPVSCSNPLNDIKSTTAGGVLTASNFTVVAGTVGPPATGTDSAGHSAATDAALYPCPPTAAQLADSISCGFVFGDLGGDEAEAAITFASQESTTTTTTEGGTTTTTGVGTTTTTASVGTTTTNASVGTTTTTTKTSSAGGGTTTTTAVAAATTVLNPSASGTTRTVLADGTLAFTGAGPGVWVMAVGGLLLLDLGFLVMTMYYRPRELVMVAGRRVSRIFGVDE